jgi:hypothetical protein
MIGTSPLVVLLRFLTREGTEFISGPFHSQNLDFTCQPADAALNDFYSFEAWHAFNVTSAGVLRLRNANASTNFQMPWSKGAAQAACVMHPKSPDAKRWAGGVAPSVLGLQVSARCPTCSGVDAQMPALAVVDWAFVPQFIALNADGRQLEMEEICGTLSLSSPTVTFWVWTGGHAVEATLQDGWPGVLSVHISEPPGSSTAAPTVSVTVVWDAASPFKGSKLVSLQLESRVSGQLHRLKVEIDGSAHLREPMAVAALPSSRGGFVLPVTFFCVVLLCSGFCLCSQAGATVGGAILENLVNFFRVGRYPGLRVTGVSRTAPPAASGALGGVGNAPEAFHPQASGISPFRRLDVRHY